jgi:hypothetical protein
VQIRPETSPIITKLDASDRFGSYAVPVRRLEARRARADWWMAAAMALQDWRYAQRGEHPPRMGRNAYQKPSVVRGVPELEKGFIIAPTPDGSPDFSREGV